MSSASHLADKSTLTVTVLMSFRGVSLCYGKVKNMTYQCLEGCLMLDGI